MKFNEEEIKELEDSKNQFKNDLNKTITPVDFLITTIIYSSKIFLDVEEIPTINADVYMCKDKDIAKYDCKYNMIKFNYKIYINAFNKIKRIACHYC